MLRLIMVLLASVAVGIVYSPVAASGVEKDEATLDAISVPVGRLALAAPVGFSAKRSAVAFPHSLHFQYTCTACHHKWDRRSEVQSCTTSQCHDRLSPPPPAKGTRYSDYADDSIGYFKYAFHRQCIGCHKEIHARNAKFKGRAFMLDAPLQKTGPTGCVGCHPK